MPMTTKEAAAILKLLEDVYDMGFNKSESKAKTWINFLVEDGDYEPSLQMAKRYIKDGNTFPPKLPHILKKQPKTVKEEPVDEKTAKHRWRMKNDPEYVAQRKQILDDFKKKLSEFKVSNDE
ncbi:hypothetical protein D3Z30_06155 [Staphylococcus warneri]|uniref:Replicative helicase inhibitor G39P N-terminal domain-containing protein n=2 Tax=Staphylococcus warneri TaxID=1292 RepID=A0AB36BFF5_STAWA|nr:hypothetical protein [Staphylococcus warneri]